MSIQAESNALGCFWLAAIGLSVFFGFIGGWAGLISQVFIWGFWIFVFALIASETP